MLPNPSPEEGKRYGFQKVVFFKIPDDGQDQTPSIPEVRERNTSPTSHTTNELPWNIFRVLLSQERWSLGRESNLDI
jgi:hypothetical protein